MNLRRFITVPDGLDEPSYRQTSVLKGRAVVTPTMSALGQKQTFALHQPMSALPLKADIGSAK